MRRCLPVVKDRFLTAAHTAGYSPDTVLARSMEARHEVFPVSAPDDSVLPACPAFPFPARMMCTCGHSEKDHAPCGKCLVEGCECEVFEKQKT